MGVNPYRPTGGFYWVEYPGQSKSIYGPTYSTKDAFAVARQTEGAVVKYVPLDRAYELPLDMDRQWLSADA